MSLTFSNPEGMKGSVLLSAPQCPQQHFHAHMKHHASNLHPTPKNYKFTPQSYFEQQENTIPLQFPSLFVSPTHALPESLWTRALIPAPAFRKLIKANYITSGALVLLSAPQKLCAEAQQCSSSTACKSHAGKTALPQCSHYETHQHKAMEAPPKQQGLRNEATVDKFCSCSDNHCLS